MGNTQKHLLVAWFVLCILAQPLLGLSVGVHQLLVSDGETTSTDILADEGEQAAHLGLAHFVVQQHLKQRQVKCLPIRIDSWILTEFDQASYTQSCKRGNPAAALSIWQFIYAFHSFW